MKIKCLLTTCLLTLGLITSNYAGEIMMNSKKITKATCIKLVSKKETQLELEQFLQKGAQLVRKNEPGTPLWFALKENNNFTIFDVFFNEQGREQHFSGQVANALKEHASKLVQNGWEKGVLQNINNFDIIASNHFSSEKVLTAQAASLIIFKAESGKNQDIEIFLKEAAKVITEKEPSTYLWFALKTNENIYAIFDAFPNQDAQKAHFSGQIASKLQKSANRLIIGGWEKGILANIHNFQIIAIS